MRIVRARGSRLRGVERESVRGEGFGVAVMAGMLAGEKENGCLVGQPFLMLWVGEG
jgi:hypothetical protein